MEFFRRKLSNGMVVLLEKRELPLVSFSISNRFGGAFEESSIKGIAHVIEHMVFTGTKTRTHEDISREIEKKGGVLNAFTANELTCFYFKLPSEHLFAGMDILIDILNNPKFDKKKFEMEKKVILEEIKMYRDDPQRYVFEKIEEAMFEKPFGEGIIGSEKTINNLDRDFVLEYFNNKYNPGNYIVSVVGDADFEEICGYLEKNFKSKGKEIEEKKIVKKNWHIVEEREGIDQANFIFGVHAPLPTSDEFYALEVLDAYLANGMSSKLFLKIREEKGLAYTVRGDIAAEKNYSYYMIYVGTVRDAVEEVKKIILEEFGKMGEMGEKDLNEAKERLIGLNRVSKENSSGVMQELIYSELTGDANEYYLYEDKIRKVKLDEVKRLAKEMVKDYSTAVILPKLNLLKK